MGFLRLGLVLGLGLDRGCLECLATFGTLGLVSEVSIARRQKLGKVTQKATTQITTAVTSNLLP